MATLSNQPARPASAAPSSAAVVDLVNSLLDAEMNSMFRFMGEGSPYLGRASVEVRRPLHEMVLAEQRRAEALAGLIESIGSSPMPQAGIRHDEQYLAFLSLKFLLPRLVVEKKLHAERYDNALAGLRSISKGLPEVAPVLQAHLDELRMELSALEQATAHVAGHVAKVKT